MWKQVKIKLRPFPRGFHLITREVILQCPAAKSIQIGLAHLHLLHTSASLSLNENADPTVRSDFEKYIKKFVPDKEPYYDHISEGPDDMSAHIKSALIGTQLSIPIRNGHFALGTWQGIYLGEHREHSPGRQILITLHGSE